MYALLTILTKSNWNGDDDKIVAGWIGFTVLMALIVATALLCWSFTRQMKKVRSADAAGVYGTDEDTTSDDEQA
ncbi:hypothetical protein [Nocardioides jiangxiensis]|uniref:Uncharacterized protein n=1 Tax=Nocardioides jiangxiensis TaxID=3064524 RepID=A0ABT9B1V4_9ACTN|nr:hypothetical protein [Nocardioides sp. WY-20]MDO7868836.1 hypothetical protein [Nocardioides sp. WY-20]